MIRLELRGVYVLLISIEDRVMMEVGALGPINLESGIYAYIGSALGSHSTSIEGRLTRHYNSQKKMHWHIDYILKNPKIKIKKAIFSESTNPQECNLVKKISKCEFTSLGPKDFGSSDCSCVSHLIFLDLKENIAEQHVWDKFIELDLKPQKWKN